MLHGNGPWYVKHELNFIGNWLTFNLSPTLNIPFRARTHVGAVTYPAMDATDDASAVSKANILHGDMPAELKPPFNCARVLVSIDVDFNKAPFVADWDTQIAAFVQGLALTPSHTLYPQPLTHLTLVRTSLALLRGVVRMGSCTRRKICPPSLPSLIVC